MSQPFVGEIRIAGFNFAPAGWAFCDGSLLPISGNETLFNLIGTTYGGDGQSTFALPDLRGRLPIHQGQGPGLSNRTLNQTGGAESVTLAIGQLPQHTHPLMASSALAADAGPQGDVLAQTRSVDLYLGDVPSAAMAASAVGMQGGSQPHDNLMPYLVLNFIISLFGIFPSQS